jgi:hypothetical protein
MSLANKALLVSLNISVWTARKLDKHESEAVEAKHGTATGVARVHKSLLPGADSLRAIGLYAGTIRTDYYANTLPWANEMQILKADGYLAFTQLMANHKRKWDSLVPAFLAEYPQLYVEARQRLNGLFCMEDYPSPDKVAEKFRMDVAFYPVPDASDWRVSLSDTETEFLRKQIEDKVTDSQGRAMKEAWERIYKVVSKAHRQLSPEGKIFDSVIENARELCAILPALNIADDPHLEAMRQQVERELCDYDADDLRKNKHVRNAVADKMAEIMAKMGPFMGAV